MAKHEFTVEVPDYAANSPRVQALLLIDVQSLARRLAYRASNTNRRRATAAGGSIELRMPKRPSVCSVPSCSTDH